MLNDASSAAVLLTFLSLAIERGVEVLLGFSSGGAKGWRRAVAVSLSLSLSLALAFGLRLDLISILLPASQLNPSQAQALTAIALAGGSAPAHELIRLLEEARGVLQTKGRV